VSYIVDRRLNSRDKSAVNRQRFLKRYRKHIKKAVSEAVTQRSITDMERGEDIGIPRKDIDEPQFGHDKGGVRDRVLPGNKEFVTGDKIKRQSGIVRSMRSAYARRIALGAKKRRRRDEIMAELESSDAHNKSALQAELEELQRKLGNIPYIDDFDLKYNVQKKQPQPSSKAVMFCLMDVSGSMDQRTKDIAKRFFILLYLFLQRNYEKTEVVFIRHHSTAKEVEEEEFFYSRETGGTVVSSALKLMNSIIEDRYPLSEWNIYGAQASDGDNWTNDSPICHDMLANVLLPQLQYYCYLEISDRGHQELWQHYEKLAETNGDCFALRGIEDYADIYPVFRDLFQRQADKVNNA